jgi:hypothetical protein
MPYLAIPAPPAPRTGVAVPVGHPARRDAQVRTVKRPWTRDWTAWTLILAPPALILGIGLVANLVSIGIGDALIDLAFLDILVALTVKLIRGQRRRSGR